MIFIRLTQVNTKDGDSILVNVSEIKNIRSYPISKDETGSMITYKDNSNLLVEESLNQIDLIMESMSYIHKK